MSTAAPPAQTGRRPSTPADKKCNRAGCQGRIEPSSDRNGTSVNECAKCGTMYSTAIATSTPTPVPTSSGAHAAPPRQGSACKVKGCPGIVGSGGCPCCAKREAFLEEHTPKTKCAICGGDFAARKNLEHCKPCRPIAARVEKAKEKTKGRRS